MIEERIMNRQEEEEFVSFHQIEQGGAAVHATGDADDSKHPHISTNVPPLTSLTKGVFVQSRLLQLKWSKVQKAEKFTNTLSFQHK